MLAYFVQITIGIFDGRQSVEHAILPFAFVNSEGGATQIGRHGQYSVSVLHVLLEFSRELFSVGPLE